MACRDRKGVIVDCVSKRLPGRFVRRTKDVRRFSGRLFPKWVVEFKEAIQATNPAIIVIVVVLSLPLMKVSDYTRDTPGPASILSLGDGLTLDSDLHARARAGTPLSINAHLKLTTSIPLAEAEDHLGVEGKHEGPEAQTPGTDGGDEKRADQGMNDGTAGAERISGRASRGADQDTIANSLGQEVVIDIDVDDGQVRLATTV